VSHLFPVLVADLLDESASDFLEGVARENKEAWVPLVAAPVDASRHVLEVYTPSSAHPLRLIADPTGPPTEHGFPLRLSLPSEEDESLLVPNVEELAELAGEATVRANERDALIGRALAGGKLQIESLVGKGMMGAVYKALHRELRIHVAVKVLHESYQHDVDFCRRFYAEALAASRLDHPNLVRVYDFGQEPDGLLYLSMEFVAGRSVRDALYTEGPMSAKRIAEIMMQVCAGLGQAHARGIIHRDVKPDNVVLVMRQDDDGKPFEQVKVCDFGLALLRTSDAASDRFAGTPVYMSPEQCRGESLDVRTDVYACGIMLYELATGTVPFLSDKPIVVINRHLTMPPAPLASLRADVDPRLEDIVQKALRKLRDDRHESVRALRLELKALLGPPQAVFDLAAEAAMVQRPAAPGSWPAPPPTSRQGATPATLPALESGPASSWPPASAPSAVVTRSFEEAPVSKRASWFEENQDSYSNFLQGLASGEKRAEEVSRSLARDPKTWLTKLLAERDARIVDRMLDEVEAAARVLAQNADARTLRAVSSTIHGIATDDKRHASVRARAASSMRVFTDPTLLAPIAERLLTHKDEHRDAANTLLLDAGVAGAYAIYGARVKVVASQAARALFVETMRGIGEAAWPVVRAALERIPASALTGAHPVGADLAEDLLLCVPMLRDEAAGHLVAKYARATEPALCWAATQALGRLWAERAVPLLLGLLDVNDDGVRAAAIAGLRELGAVDEHVARRLVPILTCQVQVGHALRIAAIRSLEFVTLSARPVAVPLLVQLVRDIGLDDATVLAASRALLRVMGNEARAVVIGRLDVASEPLKSHLLVLLRDPMLPEGPKELKDLM
jgi:serine/threonine-protein kinase